jgi:lipoate-protein ligase A
MNWFLLQSGLCPAAFNMALDEALLENVLRLGKPVLRFYGWTEPAATFGYFQKFSEVGRATLLRPLIRRPTGGGIVPHDMDWTYSFTVPPDAGWYSFSAIESYQRIHEWIQSAFTKLNVATELAPFCKKSAPGQCFVGQEKFDLLRHGEKIAGAAQRRNKFGLLIQGSVQPPLSPARADWEKAMCEVARGKYRVEWSKFSPDTELCERAEALADEKFSRESFNRKR